MFDLVAFNVSTHVWKQTAVHATLGNRASALAWIESLPTVEAHVMLEAGITTVNIANATPRAPKRLIFLGNRDPFNPATVISAITSANYQRIPLDTIYVPDLGPGGNAEFWQSLAAANGGTYTQVED